MEELLELKGFLLSGNIADALLLVEEMTEMSKDDKLNKISSFAKILLLHLIKRQAEGRTTRSWDASIDNAVYEIQKTNRRRKAGANYLTKDELREAISDAYRVALSGAAAEAFGGCYTVNQLATMCDREAVINQAIALVSDN
ncbi:MAG: DUF29 family protein [Pseudanabaenaceae cyanobacterium bins.39]|nr:DUF29 family protein [Pseudanabaenaceae cyanobacterium bins.39]